MLRLSHDLSILLVNYIIHPVQHVSRDAVDRSPVLGVNNTSTYLRHSLAVRPVSTIPNDPRGVCECIAAPRSIRAPPAVNSVDICLVFDALKGQRLNAIRYPGVIAAASLWRLRFPGFQFLEKYSCFSARTNRIDELG